jgi:hypothetical protein
VGLISNDGQGPGEALVAQSFGGAQPSQRGTNDYYPPGALKG